MAHEIPTAILKEAKRGGFTPVFAGTDNGASVYRLATPDEGADTPTGLPMYLTYKDGKVTFVDDIDALILLRRLQ